MRAGLRPASWTATGRTATMNAPTVETAMLSTDTINIVKATAPAVAASAQQITSRFYKLMFEGDRRVRAFFNQAHQHTGGQQRALAGAICAYAANIDNLDVLRPAVELIAQKHCSLGIKAEHYPIVGKHLLIAIKDVLGDAVTEQVLAAWAEAYGFLAEVLIDRENQIYTAQSAATGGWNGRRAFVVDRKVGECDIITSFYLRPQDGGLLPPFKPGQYVTVMIDHPSTPTSPRNYSLSDRPDQNHYRISVKREPGSPPGLISNYLHDQVHEGDVLHLGPPCGEFTLKQDASARPIVLISGGVGLTPMLSMLKTLTHQGVSTPIYFIHGTRNSSTHAMDNEVRAIAAASPNVRVHVRYSDPLPGDVERCEGTGNIEVTQLKKLIANCDANFYMCGPKPFMGGLYKSLQEWGVPSTQIHFEFFGPKQDLIGAETSAQPGRPAISTRRQGRAVTKMSFPSPGVIGTMSGSGRGVDRLQ
jgi:nitric oxide dioxygenase